MRAGVQLETPSSQTESRQGCLGAAYERLPVYRHSFVRCTYYSLHKQINDRRILRIICSSAVSIRAIYLYLISVEGKLYVTVCRIWNFVQTERCRKGGERGEPDSQFLTVLLLQTFAHQSVIHHNSN